MEQGLLPGTISSDVHQFSVNSPVFNLWTIVSKFLWLGLTLEEAIRRVTENPSHVFRRLNGLGTLTEGAEADSAPFSQEEGRFRLVDAPGATRIGRQMLRPAGTVKAGHLYGSAKIPKVRL